MTIDKEIIDKLFEGHDREAIFAKGGLMTELTKALSERILSAELDEHLESENSKDTNRRNGHSPKTIITDNGTVCLDIPRDRNGRFDPQLIGKYQRRFPGFDDKIVSMYARGMTVRQIQGHLEELYGFQASPGLISCVTDAVMDEVNAWQSRPLDPCYPVVFLDAIRVKIRDEGMVRNKAIYVALAILPDGSRDVLGLWIEQNEGAKFWLKVLNDLKNRGVEDILIAVVDGLKGFPQAIEAAFPQTIVQTCIIHLLRHSMGFASYKDRKPIAAALKTIYTAKDAQEGEAKLDEFEQTELANKYPAIAQSWRRAWQNVIPFFAFPENVRRIIYTTNAIESLNAKIRRAVQTKGHFPNDQAAIKLIYLALNVNNTHWKRNVRCWHEAKMQLAIMFNERFPLN